MKNKYILLLVPALLLLAGTEVASASEINVKSAGQISVKKVSFTANSVSETYKETNLDLLYSDSKEFTEDLGAVTNVYEISDDVKDNRIFNKNDFISEKEIKDDDSLKQKEEKIRLKKEKDEKEAKEAKEAKEKADQERLEKEKQDEINKQEEESRKESERIQEEQRKESEQKSNGIVPVNTPVNTKPKAITSNDGVASTVAIAEQYLGIPYITGGTSPSPGFDCSGLVQYVYAQIGISIPRITWDQSAASTIISVDQAQPGDLLFWGDQGSEYHVAIYTGNGNYIHSPQPGEVITYGSFSGFMPSRAGTMRY